MTGLEKYEYWKMLSDYDMDTAEVLIKAEKWVYVATMAQQSIERLLKGMYVCHIGKEAPKSHNISFIINKLADNIKFSHTCEGRRFLKERDSYMDDVIDIMYYHVCDYPFSYQKVMERFIEKKVAMEIYHKAEKVINWLKSFQEICENVG